MSKKDAEALEDALNTNQVLVEEIKVKNAIIEADSAIVRQSEETNPKDLALGGVKCSICDWTSNNNTHLAGHMTKHRGGQYICSSCETKFKPKIELNDHNSQCHKKQSEKQQQNFSCSN